MKISIALVVCLFLACTGQSQVLRIATTPTSIASQIPGYSQVTSINTKTYSYTPSTVPGTITPIDEDSTTEDQKVYRYADNLPVSISMSDGNITSTSVGKVWTLRISVPTALNVGFVFNQFSLSAAAEMYVFNEARTVMDTAVKQSAFTNASQVPISPFRGTSVIIYIIEKNNFSALQSVVGVNKIQAGFRNIEDVGTGNPAARGASLNCIEGIMCQPAKLPTGRSVAIIRVNGSQGTGTLLTNENNNGRAYFLTAFHVVDGGNGSLDAGEIAALGEAAFEFQLWRTACNGTDNNQMLRFTGATLVASSDKSDFILLELSNPPGVGDGVNYAGWSRSTSSPSNSGSYILHHPSGEHMRVTTTNDVKTWFWNNRFWTAHYSDGVVSPGSSGAALFNENNQVVGQLRSGWSSCDFTDMGDRYGKFSSSWALGSLQQFLSPNSNLASTNALILSPITMTGNNFAGCPSPNMTYTVPTLLGCTYNWTSSANIQLISGQATSSATFKEISSLTNDAGWIQVQITDSKGRTRVQTVRRNVTITKQILPSNTISGSDYVCSSQTYTVPAVTGVTYTWSKGSSSLVTLSPSANSVIVTRVGTSAGPVTLTLTMSGVCGNGTITKSLTVGPPIINQQAGATGYTVTSGTPYVYNDVCPSVTNTVSLSVPSASSVVWEKVTTPVNVNWYTSGNNMSFYFFSPGQTVVFRVTATNPCGTSIRYFSFRSINCGSNPCGNALQSAFLVSPNPAGRTIIVTPNIPPPCDDALNISASRTNNNGSVPISPVVLDQKVRTVRLFDNMGKMLRTVNAGSAKSVSVDVTDLPNGIYYLEITGSGIERHKIVIRK